MTLARTSAPSFRARAVRHMLMIGCATGAVLASGEAAGQSFDATSTVTHGTATITTPPGQTNVDVTSPNAVIVWRPFKFGDPVIFQPAGTTATFTGAPGFTVLNRILAQGRVQFDGTVLSRVGSVAGGTVAFSAPNGIIIGGTAVFDVGSLILTTLDPVVTASGQFIDSTGAIDFQASIPGTEVVTLAGSRITALEDGSFVLIAAPRVVHGGSVLTNGSTAYVAASSAVVRHSSGLFDIFVTSGTTVANPLVHTGRTGGPAPTGAGDAHNIYMAAVSEDLAITALVGGTVGYDESLSATVDNGTIVLSAFSLGSPAVNPATLSIGSGTYTSDVIGLSSHNATVTGNADFSHDLTLVAGTAATVRADGSVIQVGGNLAVVARNPSAPLDTSGGIATLEAEGGGQVTVTGNATVDASGVTAIPGLIETSADAVGGSAQVNANGGTIAVGGDLAVHADGLATTFVVTPDVGGSGTGGTARVRAAQGGVVTVGGNLDGSARASAQSSGGNPATPPTATGGTVLLQTRTGGQINVTGTTELRADAIGGTVTGLAGTTSGLAQGGSVGIDVATGQVQLAGVTTIDAGAIGGIGPNGGDAAGGDVTLQASEGSIQLANGSNISASGLGGGTLSQPGGTGGDGTGGNITITALGGAETSSISGGDLDLTVQGRGGDGGSGLGAVLPGQGGIGTGGGVSVIANRENGQIQMGALAIDGRGIGGRGGGGDTGQSGGAGGDGIGSDSIAIGTRREISPSGVASAGELRLASLDVDVVGQGGAGGSAGGAGATGGTGGLGQGGAINLSSESAPVSVAGIARLAAGANGGAGGLANGGTAGSTGTAIGGRLEIAATGAGGNAGSLIVNSLDGSLAAAGDSGTGNQGGAFQITTDGGTIGFGDALIANGVTGNPTTRQTSSIDMRSGTVTATNFATFESDGDLGVNADATAGLIGGSATLRSNADINVAHINRPAAEPTVGGTQVSFDALGDFTAAPGTLINGTDSAFAAAGGLASFGALFTGQDVFVSSAAIEILATGRIGDVLTQSVVLSARNPGARIGGDNVGSGYVLSAAEVGRITAGGLRINVPSAGGPANRPADAIVRDLTVDGNSIRSFGLNTLGIVQVDGTLLLSNAQPTSFIEIGGDPRSQRIQVITPGGGIRVRNGSGAPAGTVRLEADDIWVTDLALFNQLLADPNFAGRNAALLANGGAFAPRGYIEGFDVVLAPLRSLYVQNSGGPGDFGGITVGNSLTINAGGPGVSADISAFGRAVRADGSMTTGDAFFFQGIYNGTYTAGSELNLCNIPARTCPAPPPPEQPQFDNPTPSVEEVENPVGGGDRNMPLSPLDDENELIDSAAAEPLIEEPVTSGGDSGAWTDVGSDQCRADQDRARAEGREAPRCLPTSREPADD